MLCQQKSNSFLSGLKSQCHQYVDVLEVKCFEEDKLNSRLDTLNEISDPVGGPPFLFSQV